MKHYTISPVAAVHSMIKGRTLDAPIMDMGSLRPTLDLESDKPRYFNHREEFDSAVQLDRSSYGWHAILYCIGQGLHKPKKLTSHTCQKKYHADYKVFTRYMMCQILHVLTDLKGSLEALSFLMITSKLYCNNRFHHRLPRPQVPRSFHNAWVQLKRSGHLGTRLCMYGPGIEIQFQS